jgi:hypothetical protein
MPKLGERYHPAYSSGHAWLGAEGWGYARRTPLSAAGAGEGFPAKHIGPVSRR